MHFVDKVKFYWILFKRAVKGDIQQDFTTGSIGQAAFLLAVPMVLEMVMESIFAVTDIFFVSALGSEAVAVVGLTEAVMTLLYAVSIGLSMAVTAMIARRIGEGNKDAANIVAGQTLVVGLVVAITVGILGIIYGYEILELMGAEPKVTEIGYEYTSIMLGGSITILYLFLINAIFRGAGDAVVAMRSLWLANGINIILDPLLIFGIGPFPEMGVTGAAVATTIGRGVGVIYQLYHLFNGRSRIQLIVSYLMPHYDVVSRLLKLSVGGVFQFLIATASWVALVRIVSIYGSAAIAGYTIAIRVIMFTILPAWGLSNAVATLVGQNLGAGQTSRAETSVWRLAKYNVYFLLGVAILFIAFANPIISIFTDDAQVIEYGVRCLIYVSLGYGFLAVGMIVIQAFNGAGDTITPTKINFFCYWIIQIPLAFILAESLELGPSGVFWAITIAESLLAIVGVYIFKKGSWKLQTV